MRRARRCPIPTLPVTLPACVPTEADTEETAMAPTAPRGSQLVLGLVSAGLGLVLGVCLHAVVLVPPPTAPRLTPQHHALYLLLHDLAQTTTREELTQMLGRIEHVVRSLHVPPRPSADPLLPQKPVPPGLSQAAGATKPR